MAKGLREITSRIKSVKSTAQITRAMQLVASSKMKRAQDTALAGRDYGWLLADILDSALATSATTAQHTHLLVQQREVRARGILLITTDKGLCGALNANLYRRLGDIPHSAKFIAIGRKGAQYLARTGRVLLADFTISDRVHLAEVRTTSEYLLAQYCDGVVDTLEILYPRFRNTLVQEPILQPLLPLASIHDTLDTLRASRTGAGTVPNDSREMSFEPGAAAIFDELPALYFKHTLYHALLEAKASEHSARMVAMKAATDNARKITEDLTLEYNKARQAAITQEINEITAATLAR